MRNVRVTSCAILIASVAVALLVATSNLIYDDVAMEPPQSSKVILESHQSIQRNGTILGIHECAVRSFAHVEAHRDGMAVVIDNPLCSRKAVFRHCEMPFAFTTHQLWGKVPNPLLLHPGDCLALKCTDPSACHASVSAAECANLDPTVVFVGPSKRDNRHLKSQSSSLVARSKSYSPNVLLLVLDSMSWSTYNHYMKRTQKFIAGLAEDKAHFDVAMFPHMSALGAQSAINHAALLTGTVTAKCVHFKSRREGIPKKSDGVTYATYRRLLTALSSKVNSSATMLSHHHIGSWYRRLGIYRVGLFYPVAYNVWEATCMGLMDESDAAQIADTTWWRFYNEAVSDRNREVRGSQGCVGSRHVLDYLDDFIDEMFLPSEEEAGGRAPVFAVVAEQTPHQANYDLGVMEYYDERIASLLERMLHRGVLRNTVVFIAGDHGRSFGMEKHSEILQSFNDVLNPMLLVLWPTIGPLSAHLRLRPNPARRSQKTGCPGPSAAALRIRSIAWLAPHSDASAARDPRRSSGQRVLLSQPDETIFHKVLLVGAGQFSAKCYCWV